MAEGHQNHARYQRGEGRPESISSTLPVPRPYLGTSSRPAPAAVPPRTSSGSCPGCCGTGPGSRRSPPRTRPRLQQRGGSSGDAAREPNRLLLLHVVFLVLTFQHQQKHQPVQNEPPRYTLRHFRCHYPKDSQPGGSLALTWIGIYSLYIHSHG